MRYLYILLSLILLLSCEDKREERLLRWNQVLQNYKSYQGLILRQALDELEYIVNKEGSNDYGLERVARAQKLVKKAESEIVYLDGLIKEINKTDSKYLVEFLLGKEVV